MAEKIEDLNLPSSVITRLIRTGLPDNINVSKDARTAVARATSVFVLYITSSANSVATTEKRRTITANDVFSALKETAFESFVPYLKSALEEFKEDQKVKKKNSKEHVKEIETIHQEEEDDEDNNDVMEDSVLDEEMDPVERNMYINRVVF